MLLPKLSFVLGGASSGKSAFAEGLVLGTGRAPVYLATARSWDDETAAKIRQHREARAAQGWQTVEEPLNLTPALAACQSDQAVLLDCATMWLTNLLVDGHETAPAVAALMAALAACPAPVVVVSNEVGLGIVPENALARRFRVEQGALNARLAAEAGLVVAVMAGLPLVLKGQWP